MARKSRRTKTESQEVKQEVQRVAAQKPKLNAGAYVRLSVDKGDSESIETQIRMIDQFVRQQEELQLKDIYADNGYTGTNFDRPEFTRLLDDVRCGKIQCIIVKDLSRFGRNFLETGYYIENLFPHLGVRFISINDDFDSDRETDRNNIAVPIKNMVNEMYAKDFSKKQTALFELHSRRGDAKILRSTYGYRVDKERNILIPNPETAPYVRIIFRWFLSGIGMTEIVKRLIFMEVMTPFCYKATFEEGKPVPDNDVWRVDRVKTILRNQTYAGDTVYGKRRKILYKNQPMYHTKPEEWIIHKDTHEPLVTRKDFETVQRLMDESAHIYRKSRKELKENREQFVDSFPQKIRCKDCGNTMLYNRYGHKGYHEGFDGAYYLCHGDDRRSGCRQKVHEDFLRIMAMDQIRVLVSSMCSRKKLLQKMREGVYDKGALISMQKKIQNLEYQLSRAEETSAALYEDFLMGIFEEEEYQQMKEHYIMEKQRLRSQIKKSEEQKWEIEKNIDRFIEFEENIEKKLSDSSFNQQLVDELIESIEVSASGTMEIQFKCADVFQQVCGYLEEGVEQG